MIGYLATSLADVGTLNDRCHLLSPRKSTGPDELAADGLQSSVEAP